MIIIIIIYNFRKTIKVKYELIKELIKLIKILNYYYYYSLGKSETKGTHWMNTLKRSSFVYPFN